MAELIGVYYRVRSEQRDWLNERPEGASEALRAIINDAMSNGTKTAALLDERRVIVAGDSLTFTEFVELHILPRTKRDARLSYIHSPAVSDYLVAFGRTRPELQAEIRRLEAAFMPVALRDSKPGDGPYADTAPDAPPSPPSPQTSGGEVEAHEGRQP